MDHGPKVCLGVLTFIVVMLVVVLVPISFSSVEYYEYGLPQSSTGSVDTSQVYAQGRYHLGPRYHFIKYQADLHVEHLKGVSVFSTSEGSNNNSSEEATSSSTSSSTVGLSFLLDVFFTYSINRDDVGKLHEDFAKTYRTNVRARAREAIKNEAIFVSFSDYFQDRAGVEARYAAALQKSWNTAPSVFVTLDQFHLGRIQISEDVAEKQLDAKIQLEENDKESYLQRAQIEREMTAVEVNRIDLETVKLRRTANAEAALVVSMATAQAEQILQNARSNGTAALIEAAGLTTEEQLTAFGYIWSLRNRVKDGSPLRIGIDHLTDSNIVKTRAV